uniref:Cytochrome c biogenesis protein Ccs1 n=1 Tax=Pterocladia lucida TaxID=31408 RepID=A0A6M3WW53_PTELU|nr:ccs1 [Pterocladia lucida]
MHNVSFKNFSWKLIKRLSNLNFSIILLLSIACFSILGTIIEQNQDIQYYQTHYPYIKENGLLYINWKTIIFIGLDHIYENWWFLLLLFIFFSSLVTCTFSRQLPSLKYSRNWKFIKSSAKIQTIINSKTLPKKPLSNIIYSINQNAYFTFHQGNKIYAHKGLTGRIAPIFVHVSIIITIIGSLIGLISGFTVQEIIPKGEFFHVKNIIRVGQAANFPVKITGKVNDFCIDYNNDKSIKQFFSKITILNNKNKSITTKQISVNQPLIFQGMTFYQTNWEINALRFNIGHIYDIQQKVDKKEINGNNIWISTIHINSKHYLFFVIYNLQDSIVIYNDKGNLIKRININEDFYINKSLVSVKEIMTNTGIQIKTDPGIPLVYTGFLILMITTLISYISYSQLWIYTDNHYMNFIGSTNRSILSFEKDFESIYNLYIKSILI